MSLPAEKIVSEAVYWRDYYVSADDKSYEWNDGVVEEKPVSDYQTYLIYNWFRQLLDFFLETHPIAASVGLEMGFRMVLPNKVCIRKPDLGVLLNANPVPLQPLERTYHGIFDLCVEALSDSDKHEKERDTVVKKAEYASAGVKEYFILHDSEERAFYRLNARGVYVPIIPQEGVIHSEVLPGFRFRIRDLSRGPDAEAMLEDPVYRDFVLPEWGREREQLQQETALRRKAEQHAQAEAALRREAEQRAQTEATLRREAEQRAQAEIARLQALLDRQSN